VEIKKIVTYKPWGHFEQFTHNQVCTVKILAVDPSARLSYQSHKNRDEFWKCVEGSVIAVVDESETPLEIGDEILIPCGAKHRLIGGVYGGKVLEISFGEFDEKDIVRYEDDYGRESK
jgi:mannose-6-phosphate isomerase-like protein (cupin superfamily)